MASSIRRIQPTTFKVWKNETGIKRPKMRLLQELSTKNVTKRLVIPLCKDQPPKRKFIIINNRLQISRMTEASLRRNRRTSMTLKNSNTSSSSLLASSSLSSNRTSVLTTTTRDPTERWVSSRTAFCLPFLATKVSSLSITPISLFRTASSRNLTLEAFLATAVPPKTRVPPNIRLDKTVTTNFGNWGLQTSVPSRALAWLELNIAKWWEITLQMVILRNKGKRWSFFSTSKAWKRTLESNLEKKEDEE